MIADATGRLVWGALAHLIADWPLQNDWIAANKAKRRLRVVGRWHGEPLIHSDLPEDVPVWDRHPAALVHAGIHTLAQVPVFGPRRAALIALAHLVIDTRTPVAWWRQFVGQTAPAGGAYDIGAEVAIWTDQVFHLAVLAAAALTGGAK